MLVSIITVCYNSEAYIKTAVESVIRQSYTDIEYIIVDGGSTDQTLNILESFESGISRIISEKDHGIYDAMNKGLRIAKGDIIGILNSDDFYSKDDIIEKVVQRFISDGTDSIYADINYVKSTDPGKVVRKWKSGVYKSGSFFQGWHPAHPTFFVKRGIYEKYGIFNLDFKLAADFELMLRFLEVKGISTSYLAESIINMRLGGATNKNIRNIIRQNRECLIAFRKNDLQPPLLYPLYRLIPKIRQFL